MVVACLPLWARQGAAQTAVPVPLWPEGVPGAIAGAGAEIDADGTVSNVHVPTLTAFPAPQATRTGTAVIVCPGGAYRRVVLRKEGIAVAEWLNSIGVSAFVLKYRSAEYGHPAPLRDVLRAIRMVRADAARYQIDPARIGVMGFSAGGHLAAIAGTLYDHPDGRIGADLDRVSARPDFIVLVYAATVLAPGAGLHEMLGASPPEDRVRLLTPELQVTAQTPPTFLVHGGTDQRVPAELSARFYLSLFRAGVPAEIHVYQDGAHGFALLPGYGPVSSWADRLVDWMNVRGLLKTK
jgi:acetyl esterase/lipase